MLSKQELTRYHRHLILPQLGKEGQEKLKQAKILVIGAGGLGCPVLQYLVAAGVGTIGIIDPDNIEESNLQRQVLYSMPDIGKLKALVAVEKLQQQNPFIKLIAYTESLDKDNAIELISQYDIIVDGTDNFPTRYLVNDACVIANKPWVFGSIFRFQGQVSVFNYQNGASYRCLYPEAPLPGEVPDCSEAGVLGVLPGMIGTFQANEVIKMITGIGKTLSGKLLMIDSLDLNIQTLEFERDPVQSLVKELADYEEFCGTKSNPTDIKEITVKELQELLATENAIQLIDIREEHEHAICSLPGDLIPMDLLNENIHLIARNKPVVIYCHHGIRSARAIFMLQKQYSFNNLLNLKGGIDAWAKQVDMNMPRY